MKTEEEIEKIFAAEKNKKHKLQERIKELKQKLEEYESLL